MLKYEQISPENPKTLFPIPSQFSPISFIQPSLFFPKTTSTSTSYRCKNQLCARLDNNNMNKESQKRIIEINHAISGIYGEDIKTTAFRINQTRKEILKKLERKKKRAPIIYDELYSYLEKFPEEKLGLNQEFVKKKKAKLSELEERYPYKCPSFPHSQNSELTMGAKQELSALSNYFRYKMPDIQSDSEN